MGKRGGVRVIYYNVTKREEFTALIYPKNEQDELNQEQKDVETSG